MIKRIILLILLAAGLAACHSNRGKLDAGDFEVSDSVAAAAELRVSEEAMEEIVQNVSSPVEMAALINELGVPFSTRYLATTNHVDEYNTNFQMAFNLGVFGADLGYLNIYSKNSQAMDYLTAINKLADGIKVGQFFDFSTLKRLATNSENIDSLLYISVSSFNNMDSYLRDNNRGHLSALIISGIWVEGMYLVTQVSEAKSDPLLADRIGEQKINLNNLLLILNNYTGQSGFPEFIGMLNELRSVYNTIEITYEIGEPETLEMDGMVMIVQNEKSIVHITDAQLEDITRKTKEIRNKLTSM
jgi:hypothetical protein